MQDVEKALADFESDFQKNRAENLRLQSVLTEQKTALIVAHKELLEKEKYATACLQKIHHLVCNDYRFKIGLDDCSFAIEREVLEFMRKWMDMMYQFLTDLRERLAALEDRVKKWTKSAKKRIRVFAECCGYMPREYLHFSYRIFESIRKRDVMISNLLSDRKGTL